MKVEWNKVTTFSKIVALILFVALPFIGFWYGIGYGEAFQAVHDAAVAAQAQKGIGTAGAGTSGYYANVAAWQTDNRSDAGFSLAYPIDFDANDNYPLTPSMDWRLGANGISGTLFFTLTIPRAFEPQTNFADVKLTVGASRSSQAIANCLAPDMSGGPRTASTTATANGVAFTVFQSNDAGAGNYYETTSYRTLHAGQCWAIEYTIHSSQIANYPASYGLQPFDHAMITDVLNRIVGTFNFK